MRFVSSVRRLKKDKVSLDVPRPVSWLSDKCKDKVFRTLTYDMIGVGEKSFVIAIADNYQYISGLFEKPEAKRRKKINAVGTRYPGFVSDIEIVSRTLARS